MAESQQLSLEVSFPAAALAAGSAEVKVRLGVATVFSKPESKPKAPTKL